MSAFHRDALRTAGEDETALTNPARGIANRLMREIGLMSKLAPAFPTAGGALVPLRAVTEKTGRSDFSNMWSGQAARLAREMSSAALTRYLVEADAS